MILFNYIYIHILTFSYISKAFHIFQYLARQKIFQAQWLIYGILQDAEMLWNSYFKFPFLACKIYIHIIMIYY